MSSTEAEVSDATASGIGDKTAGADESVAQMPEKEIDVADIPMPAEPESGPAKSINEEIHFVEKDTKPTTNGESSGEGSAEEKTEGVLKIAEEENKMEEEGKDEELEHEQPEEVVEAVMEKRVISMDIGDGDEKETEGGGKEEEKEEHHEETEKDGEWEVIGEKEVDQAKEEVKVAEGATASTEKAIEETAAAEKPVVGEEEETDTVTISVAVPPDEEEKSKDGSKALSEGEQPQEHGGMEVDEPAGEELSKHEEEHTEEEKKEEQKAEEKEKDAPSKEEKKQPEKREEEETGTKRVLPKWMVENADAPPSPQPEESVEKGEGAEGGEAAADATPVSTPGRGRGRGRGGRGRGSTRSALVKPPQPTEGEQQADSLSAGRPRRSTRSTVDYAHPDVATVVAEQEDLENELQQKVTRSRGKGRSRGRGRGAAKKVAGTDDEDAEDSGSEYGASSKKKKSSTPGKGRGRGRGRGGKTRRTRSAKKKGKKDESEEEEEEEMQLEEDNDPASPGSGEEAYKPAPSKRRSEPTPWKQPPKKRGRHAANAQKEHDH
ncbi:Dynein heavy chain-like protein [Toxocara canis]|uniref:Dynein heavy chain-like protein n=1 Tax=Toxocara canis TaxID=6265 RepID=A0A0B2VNL0_TOXCA|nr:Dynein heavy chain-like protein [Toxocara canis]